jgi:hypothetical protein
MRRLWWGIVFIIIGLWIWLSYLGILSFGRDWSIIVILYGIWILIKGIAKTKHKRVKIVIGDKLETTEDKGKYLRIHVTDKNTGELKANIKVPVGIVKFGKDFIPNDAKIKINAEHIDIQKIIEAIDNKQIGLIFSVEENDKKVEFYIE